MSVPEVVVPPRSVDHETLVGAVRAQYGPLLGDHPGDPGYQDSFCAPAKLALQMCGVLAIKEHPLHLPVEEILRPRGAEERNAQARQAFDSYAPLAAKAAMDTAQTGPDDIGCVIVASSTIKAMPSLAHAIMAAIGLSPRTDAITLDGEGCNGGAATILRAQEYVLARQRPALMVVADYVSPWYYREADRRGDMLLGSIISSALFSDATAAAVMSPRPGPGPGFTIRDTVSFCTPGTDDALGFEVLDDGWHFYLRNAPKLVPSVLDALQDLLARQGWGPEDLDIAALHSGGNSVIKAVQKGLHLTDHQVLPAWHSLQHGNLVSAAAFDALRFVATDPRLRPRPGAHGIVAGFGPGFAASAASWDYYDPAPAPGSR
jgi:predicted naringenin-chalcone synthase